MMDKEFIFDGNNFECWRAWIMVQLASEGMLQCVQYDPDDLFGQFILTADHSIGFKMRQMLLVGFKLQDLKCTRLLLQNIGETHSKHFHSKHTASDIWNILNGKYGSEQE
uniref:DUF4219 domain-containing protein n=1 Tax=Anopheles funestus TaxID=62324 RepID=A0A182S255_ANOFN